MYFKLQCPCRIDHRHNENEDKAPNSLFELDVNCKSLGTIYKAYIF